jgi:hypothetical protein
MEDFIPDNTTDETTEEPQTSLEIYCSQNPDALECRIYDV